MYSDACCFYKDCSSGFALTVKDLWLLIDADSGVPNSHLSDAI
mgnify:CR=1 FL=1